VFIRAERTEGLWVEIALALSLKRPDRVVFIIPFADDQYAFDIFHQRLQNLVPHKVPFIYGLPVLGTDITGLLFFDEEWPQQ